MSDLVIEKLTAEQAESLFVPLCDLLRDGVESGASIGYLLPLAQADVESYWRGVIEEVREGTKILLVARQDGEIAGSVQLELVTHPNGRHRAEVQKLMVHTRFRRQGIGVKLMKALEEAAHDAHRTLLVLDTRRGDSAEPLYAKLGYIPFGVVPDFALGTDGVLSDTVFFYKQLPRW
jgi:GNAT superfamily N-acetyltransferase